MSGPRTRTVRDRGRRRPSTAASGVGRPVRTGPRAPARGHGPSAVGDDPWPDGLCALLSRILRWGVHLSAAIIGVGLMAYLVAGYSGYPHGRYPRAPLQEALGLAQGRPYAIIELGLVVLAATPVVRVAAEAAWFLRDRRWTYLALAGFTLAMLLLSFLLGRRL